MKSETTTPDSRVPAPEHIGPYRILGLLGQGGMGMVYEAAETGAVRRRVALKIVRAGLNSREVLARFALERQALALMNHEAIAKVFHAGETEAGEPYFAMELVHGLPITEYCDSQRLTTRQRLELFAAVCQAVQHAHQKGVIHRDLKPSNILVTEQDGVARPKVIDFGIAKALSPQLTDSTLVSRLGEPLGTALYMSPEQADSSGLDVDTRTDIYSLGVILFELLVGEPPESPQGEALHIFMARLAARRTDPPMPSSRLITLGTGREAIAFSRHTDPESLRRQLRGDLDWIVMKALDPDRARRYDSATALAADIARHLANEPVAARAPSTPYRIGKFIRRHRVAVPLSALALVAIATSASFAVVGMLRAMRAEQTARNEAAAARSVTDFLVELFKKPAPGEIVGDQLTARELLDRGARRASRDLANQPLLQGRIMHSVGSAYAALGLYEEARAQLDAALAARVRTHGPTSLPVAETELALAEAAASHGDLNAADGHYARAMTIRESLLGRSHPLVARVAYGRGTLRWQQGRLDEAEVEYARALAIDERSGADSAVAHDLMGWAVVLWQRKRFAQAETLMKRSLAVQVQQLGPDHSDVAPTLNNLGALYWSMERYADALPLYERVRTTFERTLDPSHPKLATLYSNLAETYWKLGRSAEAEPLFRRALAIKEARLSPNNPSLAITLHSLAGLLHDEGKTSEAEAAYRRALDIRVRALGPANAEVAETSTALATLLRAHGRIREADSLAVRFNARR